MDAGQLELMQTILHTDGDVVLANNERIVVPDTLRFIWEVRCLHICIYALWNYFFIYSALYRR